MEINNFTNSYNLRPSNSYSEDTSIRDGGSQSSRPKVITRDTVEISPKAMFLLGGDGGGHPDRIKK